MVTTKIHSLISKVPQYSFVDVLIRSTNGNIRECLLFNYAFIILMSYFPLFFSFCKTSKKQHFWFFCPFPKKIVRILILKVEYLENSLADFNNFGLILQDFERLSDEINLFQCCNSPLRSKHEYVCN